MKTSRNLEFCVLILPLTLFLLKYISTSTSGIFSIHFDQSIVLELNIQFAVTPSKLHDSGYGGTAHPMVSYSTQDGLK